MHEIYLHQVLANPKTTIDDLYMAAKMMSAEWLPSLEVANGLINLAISLTKDTREYLRFVNNIGLWSISNLAIQRFAEMRTITSCDEAKAFFDLIAQEEKDKEGHRGDSDVKAKHALSLAAPVSLVVLRENTTLGEIDAMSYVACLCENEQKRSELYAMLSVAAINKIHSHEVLMVYRRSLGINGFNDILTVHWARFGRPKLAKEIKELIEGLSHDSTSPAGLNSCAAQIIGASMDVIINDPTLSFEVLNRLIPLASDEENYMGLSARKALQTKWRRMREQTAWLERQ